MRVLTPLSTLAILAALAATGCAHQSGEVRRAGDAGDAVVATEPAAVQIVNLAEAPPPVAAAIGERRPPEAEVDRLRRFGHRPAPSGETVRIPTDGDGLTYAELFGLLSREIGVNVRFESNSATVKARKLTTAAPSTVAEDDLLAWAQDACFFDGLLLVPYGPADRHEYAAIDMANALAPAYATPVSEDDLPALAGRVGLYVTCTMTLPEDVDTARARNALAQQSTRIAGIGRVNEIDKTSGFVIVTDFAPVAAAMRNALDRMAVSRYERLSER